MKIGEREIGPSHEPYVIAEIGVNHDGSAERAVELTRAAAEAGADAIKLQLFETDRLMSRAAKLAAYQKAAGETDPFAMLRRLELSAADMRPAIDEAHRLGLHAIVSVFSVELVAEAESLGPATTRSGAPPRPGEPAGWDAYKSASPDVINRPLLEAMADTGRPLIVSTGASTPEEVRRAAGWLGHARDRLAFLQCVSSYPAPTLALGGIGAIAQATAVPTPHPTPELPVGYSDHTPHVDTGARAVAAGASILEKHFTHDTTAAGPDHAASLEPAQLAEYIRLAKNACSNRSASPRPTSADLSAKAVLDCERDVREKSRQSLTATRDLAPGEVITRADLTIKRPGTGLPPFELDRAVGQRAVEPIAADTPIPAEAIEGPTETADRATATA